MDFDFVEIAKIDPNPRNPRRLNIPTQDPKLSYLKDSISHFGVLVPVVLTPKGNRFLLIDGERRYHAAKAVGHDKLPAFILRGDEGRGLYGKDLLLRMFQIHHMREPWGAIQDCAALETEYKRIIERKDIQSIQDQKAKVNAVAERLASLTGIDERTAFDRIKFLRWPKQVKDSLYDQPDPDGYWYICEIEEKIIIPALCNYPEYFEQVSEDDVRTDLFAKLNVALARATDVRRVAPFFRAALARASDRKKVQAILKKLHTTREMTYEEAEDEFKREFPNLQRREPPTPRRLLGMLVDLERRLQEFDVSAVKTAKKRAKATSQQLTDAVGSLQSALHALIDELRGESQ